MHGLARNGQQIGVLGGNQRTDEVQRALVHKLKILFGVVPLVEDQGDLANLLRERTAAFKQVLSHTVEAHRIVLIARVGVMKQRDLTLGGDHHGQSQEAKMVAPRFTMAALWQLCPQVETVQEDEELGGVKEQAAEIQAETDKGGMGQIRFDGREVLETEPLHV